MKAVKFIVRLLVVVGAINWGLWGFFQFDLVAFLLGGNSTGLARIVYGLVGIAGVLSVKSIFSCCCSCHKGGNGPNCCG